MIITQLTTGGKPLADFRFPTLCSSPLFSTLSCELMCLDLLRLSDSSQIKESNRLFLGSLFLSDTAWKWKFSQRSKLGTIIGLILFVFHQSGLLSFVTWCPVSWKLSIVIFVFFPLSNRRNPVPVTPSWLKAKTLSFLSDGYYGFFYYLT